MFHLSPKHLPGAGESISLLLLIMTITSYFIIGLETVPHIPLLLGILIMITYGTVRKFTFSTLQYGMTQGAHTGLGAVLLFFLIGILISSWMASGTIPVLMYSAFTLTEGPWFFAVSFAITSLVGVALGSSFTTAATVGVALMGAAASAGFSLAVTAGAVVSGSFFGDKMSPLSDTTNLSSTVVNVDLFEHIKNMAWTTIPAFIISFIGFGIMSPSTSGQSEELAVLQRELEATQLIHWSSWIPLIVLAGLTLDRKPAFISLALTSVTATVIAGIRGVLTWPELWNSWFNGFTRDFNHEMVNELLSNGGINEMLFTISLVLLALALGGLFFVTGLIPSILKQVQHALTSARSVVLSTALTAIGINIAIGEQYLSILLTGEAYQDFYEKAHLARKNLSRTLEDAGTVINPLVPWSVCGVFLADVLDIAVIDYLPFAFFCLLCPLLTILYGLTGKTLTKA
ncbi:Na+/H+ antiporter NhaC [Halobacillus sp. A5]|uniref:Na+/H+ antiporter NhaC n=1 Tax=Halobacillus sp. A5 TaxID=2880263 RepID=UPI0020A6A5A7|nr:Na+/H+ antiporter NhaC [Halobacillus sp. A5]MCP3026788.1 Na+/H+ antiporter NhaC [Halobacillus sp. A5]